DAGGSRDRVAGRCCWELPDPRRQGTDGGGLQPRDPGEGDGPRAREPGGAGGRPRQGYHGAGRPDAQPARGAEQLPASAGGVAAVPDAPSAGRSDVREPVGQPLLPPARGGGPDSSCWPRREHAMTPILDPVWPWSWVWEILQQVPAGPRLLALLAALAAVALPVLYFAGARRRVLQTA